MKVPINDLRNISFTGIRFVRGKELPTSYEMG